MRPRRAVQQRSSPGAALRRAACLLLGAVLAGCGAAPQTIKLVVVPAGDMNDTRSCYLLTRAVDEDVYIAESYEDVVAKVMTPDDSVQGAEVIFPGVVREIQVTAPEKGRLAIYALFRQPDRDAWRLLLPSPPPERIELRLERGRLCGVGGEMGAARCRGEASPKR